MASREFRLITETRDEHPSEKPPACLKTFFAEFARENIRDFPWRRDDVDPYELLVAEVLLKQTRAGDVVPVWRRVLELAPSAGELARAEEEALRNILETIGLQNQRSAALRSLGVALEERHGGAVPSELEALLALPHVGVYTSCALSCFGFGKQVPIVDANILRVLGRITGQDLGRDVRREREAWVLAWHILPDGEAALHNYGLLDFSALVCKPRTPDCEACDLSRECQYPQ